VKEGKRKQKTIAWIDLREKILPNGRKHATGQHRSAKSSHKEKCRSSREMWAKEREKAAARAAKGVKGGGQ